MPFLRLCDRSPDSAGSIGSSLSLRLRDFAAGIIVVRTLALVDWMVAQEMALG